MYFNISFRNLGNYKKGLCLNYTGSVFIIEFYILYINMWPAYNQNF